MKHLVFALTAVIATPALAAKSDPVGFTCTAQDGSTKRFNIDLPKKRYDDGTGTKPLDGMNDTTITLKASNPDMLRTPLGPVFATLVLDRASLVLTDQTLIPDRNVNRTTLYQCVKGARIDFTAGRQF